MKFLKGFIPSRLSILVTILGFITGFVITFAFTEQIPESLKEWFVIYNYNNHSFSFEDLMFLHNIFSYNLLLSFLTIIAGVLLVAQWVPLFSTSSMLGSMMYIAIYKYGVTKSLILMFGSLHIYPEILAIMLVADSGTRIAKKAFLIYKKDLCGAWLCHDFHPEIKRALVDEFVNSFPRIVLLLFIAAILEAFWIPY